MAVIGVKALIRVAFLLAPVEPRIMSARQVAETLAIDLGRPVIVSRDLADHRVLLLRQGRSPDVALQALAACLRAHVERDGQGYIVRRISKELEELRAKQISDRAVHLNKTLKEIAEYRSAKLDGKEPGSAFSEALKQDNKGFFNPAPGNQSGGQSPTAQYLLPAQDMLRAICESVGTNNLAQDMWMDVANLAGMVMYHPGLDGKPETSFTRESFDPKYKDRQFRLGFTKREVFTIHLPNRGFITCTLPERMENRTEPLAYADFPSEIRDRLWKLAVQKGKANFDALSVTIKANAASNPVGPGGQPSPPPR